MSESAQQKECLNCGAIYETTREYCHNCGEELEPKPEAEEEPAPLEQVGDEYFCGNCGTEVAADTDTCPDCGTHLF